MSGLNSNAISQMTPGEKLRRYLKAYRPIIYIQHFDFQMVDDLIRDYGRKALGQNITEIKEFNEAGGEVRFDEKSIVTPKGERRKKTLEEFLDEFANKNAVQISKARENYLLVLKEIHGQISDQNVCSLLQTIAARNRNAIEGNSEDDKYRVQVVIVDSLLRIPPELEKLTTIIEIKPPTDERIEEIIKNFIDNVKKKTKQTIDLEDNFCTELVDALKGLSEFEIKQLLTLATDDNKLDEADLPLIHEEKRQLIQKSGLLELVDSDVAGVGGLEKLREFINNNKDIFKNPGMAKKHGVDAPAGIMIVGMPGCGKSLMAKTVAKEFGIPLLKLDVGRLMGKYVGESENNLHRAVAVAESAAPCVLWIDEIEKAFSGIGEGGGGGSSMTRMFGIFLTWMQEKTASVYVVATANNIDKLPPEFLRRGRFDEIFQVGFPKVEERRKILEVHICKRNGGQVPKDIDLDEVAGKLEDKDNYSGADIESIVKEAMRRVFTENLKEKGRQDENRWRSLTTSDLMQVIGETKSSYHSQKEKLDKMLKKLKELDARSAS